MSNFYLRETHMQMLNTLGRPASSSITIQAQAKPIKLLGQRFRPNSSPWTIKVSNRAPILRTFLCESDFLSTSPIKPRAPSPEFKAKPAETAYFGPAVFIPSNPYIYIHSRPDACFQIAILKER